MTVVPPGTLTVDQVRQVHGQTGDVLHGWRHPGKVCGLLGYGHIHVAVREDVGKRAAPHVLIQGTHVIFHAKAAGFTRLRGHIADIDAGGAGGFDGTRNTIDQQIGQHAGVEAAGAGDDQVSIQNRFDGGRVSAGIVGLQEYPLDLFTRLGNGRFTAHTLPAGRVLVVAQVGAQRDVFQGRRQDLPPHRQDAARLGQALLETAGHVGHGRNEEIAERMPMQPHAFTKPVLEQPREQPLGVR